MRLIPTLLKISVVGISVYGFMYLAGKGNAHYSPRARVEASYSRSQCHDLAVLMDTGKIPKQKWTQAQINDGITEVFMAGRL